MNEVAVTAPDKLATIFALQHELNAMYEDSPRVRQGLAQRGMHPVFTKAYWAGDQVPGHAKEARMVAYADAAIVELVEFKNELNWAYWKKPKQADLVKAKVEMVDVIHFVVSICLLLDLTPEGLLEEYRRKHAINQQRTKEA